MKMPGQREESLELLRTALSKEKIPAVKKRMFGHETYFLRDYMFAGVFGEDIFVHVGIETAEAGRAKGAGYFEPMGKRLRNYITLPHQMQKRTVLETWLRNGDFMIKFIKILCLCAALSFIGCAKDTAKPTPLVNWIEIPVKKFERAQKFYATVLATQITKQDMQGIVMGFLAAPSGVPQGAIVQGKDFEPSMTGSLVYLNGGNDLTAMLGRIEPAGGKVIVPKTKITDEFGFFALFIDTEGNKVALHSPK